MIRLTAPNGKYRYFSPELIVQISEGVDETFVWVAHADRAFTVRETPQEVVRKVFEYKLAMVDYTQSSYSDEIAQAKKKLEQLAGLEGEHD